MRVRIDSGAISAIVTLAPDEVFNIASLDLTVHRISLDPANVRNVDVILPAVVMNANAEGLAALGFVVAGCADGNNTQLVMRKKIIPGGYAALSSGIGASSADLSACRIAHSQETMKAQRDAISSFHMEDIEFNVAKIEREAAEHRAMRDQPLDNPVARKQELQERLRQLQRKPEIPEGETL